MPRPPRTEASGAIHHVYNRGVNRETVFRDDRDRRRYLQLLGETVAFRDWQCLAFALMGNHMHLLIRTEKPNLASGMQAMHSAYVRGFNDRTGRPGHLYGGRYGAKLIRSDAQLFTVAAYIALNPVEAGLCARARDYRWSSHGALAAGWPPAWLDEARLFAIFDAMTGGAGERQFNAFVDPS